MKNFIRTGVIALGFVLAISPTFALAQTTSVQSQIAALLAELQQLQAQIAQLQGQTGSTSTSCVNLSYDLYGGVTDSMTQGQVTQLQQFLGVNATGYFGPLTEQAVQNWQSSNGVVSSGSPDTTGYGYVGPKTRVAMGCGSNITSSNASAASNNTVTTSSQSTNTTTPACSITASPNPASSGQAVTLNWTSQNAVSAQWVPDTSGKDDVAVPTGTPSTSGAASVTASVIGNPSVTLEVFAANGASNTCTTTFSVPSPYPTSQSVGSVSGISGAINQSSLTTSSANPTITGTATNLTGVYLSISDSNGIGVSGSPFLPVSNGQWSYTVPQTLSPGTYTVQLLGTNLSVTGTLTITGQQSPVAPIISSFTASPSTLSYQGQSTTLSWSSNAAQGCLITGPYTSFGNTSPNWLYNQGGASGSFTTTPNQTTTYSLECNGANPGTGKDAPSSSQTVIVTVPSTTPTPAINSFSASSNSITAGQTATLSYSASNVDLPGYGGSCYITSNGQQTGSQPLYNGSGTGSYSFTPATTTTYTLTCNSSAKDGSPTAQQSLTVTVGNAAVGNTTISSQNYALPNTSFTISGPTSFKNSLFVVLVSQSYTGPTDWTSVVSLLKISADSTAEGVSAPVSNGTWSATFQTGLPQDSYNVYIYNGANYNLVGQGVFYATYKG